MDPEPPPVLPPRPKPKVTSATVFKLALGLVVALVLIAALSPLLLPSTGKDLAWLSASEFARISRPGPFTKLRYRLLRFAGPLLQHLMRNKPQITIDSRFLCLSRAEADQLGVGDPTGTNAEGGRAWILSATQLEAVRGHLKNLPESTTVVGPRITTMDGGQAEVFAGQSTSISGTLVPTGVTLELTPTVSSGAIDLLLGIRSTEAVASNASSPVTVRTNLAVSCRVLFPNAGGLLVAGPATKRYVSSNYWCVVSATAVDAQGRPIKR